MKRFFTLALGALAMVAVALISAFIAMRLAIHGREVEVPALTGLTVADAGRLAERDGLNLALENRFYSNDVPAGHILAQDPVAGSHVRREWQVRITESLGAQAVAIPDLTGQSERAATVSIRRLSLDLGAVAHLAVPGGSGAVLAQTPPANSGGVAGPRVSLLVGDPEGPDQLPAYVMPSLVGLTYAAAASRSAAMGLHLLSAPDPTQAATAATQPESPTPDVHAAGVVTSQTPQAGRRVQRGDAVHIALGHIESSTGVPPTAQ